MLVEHKFIIFNLFLQLKIEFFTIFHTLFSQCKCNIKFTKTMPYRKSNIICLRPGQCVTIQLELKFYLQSFLTSILLKKIILMKE